MARGGDQRRTDRRCRARSASPPPPVSAAISQAQAQAVRTSRCDVVPASVRGGSVPPRRDDGGVPELESLRVAALMEKPRGTMVHPQMRVLLSYALTRINKATSVDEETLDMFLKLVSESLLQSDVISEVVSRMVFELRTKMDLAGGCRYMVHQTIKKELCRLIDSGEKPSFVPKKGKPCVVLVVGLKGSGKTSSCAKFAYYHQLKGYSPSIVCADTKGEQAFHRLKQMAQQAQIPFYGSPTELSPAKIAVRGVEKLGKDNSDLIIIDTSGGYMSDEVFWSEICQVEKATKPDLVVLVVEAGAGHSTAVQAKTFRRKISIGSVIVTKMDEYAKGGGALNGLAAAKLPVILLGVGKRKQDLEVFNVKLFVNNLLDNKDRTLSVDTETVHKIFDDLKLSDTERRSAIEEVTKECCNAYNAVLEKYKLLAGQICSLESKYKRLCDVLGENDLKNAEIQSAATLEDRRNLLLIRFNSLEKEKDSRMKKLQVLLSKALALWDLLGVTNSEQSRYKHMLADLSSFVQAVDSLSTKTLLKFEARVKELELKKAEHIHQSRENILRQGLKFIRGGTEDRGGLKDLIKMTVAWESKHGEVILYKKKSMLTQLRMIEDDLSLLNSDVSRHGVATSDTSMEHSSSSSSSRRSDPDYMPESTESDVDMGEMASDSSVSLGE